MQICAMYSDKRRPALMADWILPHLRDTLVVSVPASHLD